MRRLYNNELQQKLYTPLTYEESIAYIDNYYQRQATAFNVSVVCIISVGSNGEVNYVEKTMKIISVNSEKEYAGGGTSIPTKSIQIDNNASNLPVKKGRLVYDNISTILGNGLPRTVKLWVPKGPPYDITTKDKIYTVHMDNWSPYTATNYGKYGTWDLTKIEQIKANQ